MGKRIGECLFWGLLVGYLAAAVLGRSVWLDMRVNTSLIIPILSLSGAIWGFFKEPPLPRGWFPGLEVLLLAVFWFIYRDPGALTVIPAIKLREAFGLSFLSLSEANTALVILLAAGNILVFAPNRGRRTKKMWGDKSCGSG
jgi:hypothetical protein